MVNLDTVALCYATNVLHVITNTVGKDLQKYSEVLIFNSNLPNISLGMYNQFMQKVFCKYVQKNCSIILSIGIKNKHFIIKVDVLVKKYQYPVNVY